jgi:hypothetical protein
MSKHPNSLEVKFTVSDFYAKKILYELYRWFTPDYRILFLNKNTSLHIFTPWGTLIAYFFIGHENIITVRFTTNWNNNDKNIILNCITKIYNWEYIPDSNLCCGLFRNKDELKFKM